ncbi:hypothetical protein [Streptomyces cadmiisoli]|uniref:hypothetical protein n=1 Tax=Streptomyces cadmiisoli TaxID=2184053 RepID=UPI0036670410
MLMPAALYLLPDPDDEQPPPPDTAGEQHPAPEPAPVPAGEQEPGEKLHDADEPAEEHPAPEPVPAPAVEQESGEEQHDADELTEELDEDEDAVPRRAIAMPDLRPYSDVAAVPQVITAGVDATRHARARMAERRNGRPSRLLTFAVDVVAGSVMLLRHGAAWLRGEYGRGAKGPGRLGMAFLGGYFAYRTVDTWPLYGGTALGAVWLAAALGEQHRQRAQAAEQAKKKTKGKAAKDGAEEATEQAPERRSWWSRITAPERPHEAPADTPDEQPAETPAEDAGDSPDEPAHQAPGEAPAEPPAPPSEEAIAGALHHLVGEGRGVLLTTLAQHLEMAHTRALREVLDGAGIRVRPGVRTTAGNGPGIHADDFPPLPSLQDGNSDACCSPTPTANNAANAHREGLDVGGNDPGEEYPFDVVPDPERGPSAWKIVHRG